MNISFIFGSVEAYSNMNSSKNTSSTDVPDSAFGRLFLILSMKDFVAILLFLLLWAYSILKCFRLMKVNLKCHCQHIQPSIVTKYVTRAWNRIINFSGDHMLRQKDGIWYRYLYCLVWFHSNVTNLQGVQMYVDNLMTNWPDHKKHRIINYLNRLS